MIENIIIFFDGAAKGNPGPAGIGVIVLGKNNMILLEVNHFIGTKTNNQAEYEALLAALGTAENFRSANIIFRTDSELIFRQITGKYKVRDNKLKRYHQRALEMMAKFANARLEYIPREKNRAADRSANQAIKHYLKYNLKSY